MVRLANGCFASQTQSALRFSLMIRKLRCRSILAGATLAAQLCPNMAFSAAIELALFTFPEHQVKDRPEQSTLNALGGVMNHLVSTGSLPSFCSIKLGEDAGA
jgi:hypothetical protein